MSTFRICMTTLLLACVIGVMACVAYAQGGSGINETITRPEVVIPFMKTTPVIDGIISDNEYPTLHIANLVAGNDLTLQQRKCEFWLGSDGKLLYLAFRTEVNPTYGAFVKSYPPKGKRDAGALFGGIFGMVHEDMVDFWIDNNPGGLQGKWYRVAVNPVGAIFDVVYDHVYNIPINGWRVNMTQANKVVGNVWSAEFAIDPKSFKLKDLRTPFTFRANRFFTLPDDYSHWENCSYVADFPGMGVNMPQTMPLIHFVDVAPVVQEVSVHDAAGLNLSLEVKNPSGKPLPVKVTLGYRQEKQAYQLQNTTATLAPGASQRFTFKRPYESATNYLAYALETVSSADGKTIYFTRDFKWNSKPEGVLWEDRKPPVPDPVAKYEIEFHPTPKVLRWRADISGNPDKATLKQFRVRVVDTNAQNIVREQKMDIPTSLDAIGQIELPNLAAGRYEAQLFLDGATPATAPGKAMVFNYVTDFPWLNNTIGISDEVIPPFTPLTVSNNTVGAILRQYTMTDTGLWAQVVALDRPIFTAPMRFDVKQGGKLQHVTGQLTFTEKKGSRVVAESNWTAGALQGKTISDYDYDGCMKVTLTLSQTSKATIDSMEMVIPISNKMASLFHENGDGLRYNEAGFLPKGQGIIWSSDQASKSSLAGTFIPYLWVGGEERGLCWFANNDKDWVVDYTDKTPALALERKGDTLNLHVRFIQKPTTLTSAHTIVFGLQATPTRPMPTNWQSFGYGGSKTFNWAFAGMSNYYGCPGYSVEPLNNDYTIIQKVAQSKKENNRDNAFFDAYIKAHSEWKGEIAWASSPGKASAVIPYTNIRGDEKHNLAWIVYQDEWKTNSFPVWDMFEGWGYERKADYDGAATSAKPDGIDFTVRLPKSRRDYLLYMYKKFFDNGFDGIYWDNTYIFANNNPVDPDVYMREDGQVQPSTDIWAMRELFKRTAVLIYQMGKQNASMAHSTNSFIVPMMSWVGYNLDWEWKYGPDDFQNRVARDYTRAATMGRQAGSIPAILGGVFAATEAENIRVGRTRTGMLAVHELTSWQGDLPTTTYLWSIGYGSKDCLVYNYWDEKPIAKITGLDAEFLVLDSKVKDTVAVLITDFGNGGEGTIKLDIARLGLPANFVAVNQEHPEQKITAVNGAFKFPIKKHDYQLFVISKR